MTQTRIAARWTVGLVLVVAVMAAQAKPTAYDDFSVESRSDADLLGLIRNRHVLPMDKLVKSQGLPFDSHILKPALTKQAEENLAKVKKVTKKRKVVPDQDADDAVVHHLQRRDGAHGNADQSEYLREERAARGYIRTDINDYQGICGKQKEVFTRFRPTFRILNGTCASYGELPWVAQIQLRAPGGTDMEHQQHCGGTIISDDLVLTAAHCFAAYSHTFMRVVVGQHDLGSVDEEEQVFDIEDVVKHKHWDSPREGRYSNDIALVKLRRKGDRSGIRFSSNVAPACLPEKDLEFESGTDCVIAGWGKTQEKGSVHKNCLQAATVPIISNEECQEMYSRSNKRIGRGMTCAGYREGGVDTCKGDSGGPLACIANGRFHIYGVVSWGEGCGAANRPGVYSRVQYYRDWIETTARKING